MSVGVLLQYELAREARAGHAERRDHPELEMEESQCTTQSSPVQRAEALGSQPTTCGAFVL